MSKNIFLDGTGPFRGVTDTPVLVQVSISR